MIHSHESNETKKRTRNLQIALLCVVLFCLYLCVDILPMILASLMRALLIHEVAV
jgi:hypothetical protein